MTYTCIVCQATKTETVARTHVCTFINKNTSEKYLAVEADCLNPARYFYSCSCGEKGSDTFAYGSPLGHSYGTPTYTWNEQNCTATRVCLNDSTHKETETVTGVYIKDTDATCTNCEKGHYKATFTNSAFTEQNTASGSVDNGTAKVHTYVNGVCSVCGNKEGVGAPLYTYTLNDFGKEILLNLYEDGSALMGVDQTMVWEQVDNLIIVSGGAVWLHIPFKIEQDGKTISPYLAEEQTPLYYFALTEYGDYIGIKFLNSGKVLLMDYVNGELYQWFMFDYVKEGNILNVEMLGIKFIINDDGSLSLYEEQEQPNENRRYYSFEEGVLSDTGYIELKVDGTFEVKGLQPEFSGTYIENNSDLSFRANIGGQTMQFAGSLYGDILTLSLGSINRTFKYVKYFAVSDFLYDGKFYCYENGNGVLFLSGKAEQLTWENDDDLIIVKYYTDGGITYIPFKIEQDGRTLSPYLAEEQTPLYSFILDEGGIRVEFKFLYNGKVLGLGYINDKLSEWYLFDYVKEGDILIIARIELKFKINNDGSLSLTI